MQKTDHGAFQDLRSHLSNSTLKNRGNSRSKKHGGKNKTKKLGHIQGIVIIRLVQV